MRAQTFVKVALVLVALTALLFWRDVWAWVDGKSSMELAGDILGFALKWFYLAIFGFLLATVPHYVKPWLKLARLNGRRNLRAARRGRWRGQQVEARTTMPRMNKNEALLWMMSQISKSQTPTQDSPKRSTRLEDGGNEIKLRF